MPSPSTWFVSPSRLKWNRAGCAAGVALRSPASGHQINTGFVVSVSWNTPGLKTRRARPVFGLVSAFVTDGGVCNSSPATMSTAHRPTWDPAQAKDVKGGSRQFSVRDMAMHTKLKFRQVGQTSVAEVKQRDLRAELFAAELDAKNKKRKAEGLPPLAVEGAPADEESNKRRKLLQESLDLDKDDEDEEDAAEDGRAAEQKDKDADDSDSDSDEDDDEDETAELLRELEKIKKERAEEKARLEREQSASDAATREAEVATGNPLLNLAAALGQQVPTGVNTTVPGTFAVKKRWDDDLIFKNQAISTKDKPTHFVNDLLRTEFHKKFMAKFIK